MLTAGLPELAGEIAEQGAEAPRLLALFEHLDQAADMLRPRLTPTVLNELADAFHRCLVKAWAEHLAGTPHAGDPILPEYLAGALTAVVRTYLTRRDREPPAAVAESFTRHTRAVLYAVPRPRRAATPQPDGPRRHMTVVWAEGEVR